MRIVQFLALVVWACILAGAANAQDTAQCANIEKVKGAEVLQMLERLNEVGCLGGEKDAAPVTIAVRRLVPETTVPPEQLDEVTNVARAAIGQVADYLHGAMLQQGPGGREILAALAGQVELLRAKLSRNELLGEQDAKGWEWHAKLKIFQGLPSPKMDRLDVNCVQASDFACREAVATGRAAFRAAALVSRALSFSNWPSYNRALSAARVRDAQWTAYFDDARLQYPWELLLNGRRHGRENRKAGGFADVPNDQWILLHPGVGLEYVRNAPKGSRFEPALVVEIVGYNRWSWTTGGGMGRAYGISLIQTYSDRAGLGSARPGIMFHFDNRFSLALTREGGETGAMLSLDLSKLVSKVEADARSRFRLLGSGRMAD